MPLEVGAFCHTCCSNGQFFTSLSPSSSHGSTTTTVGTNEDSVTAPGVASLMLLRYSSPAATALFATYGGGPRHRPNDVVRTTQARHSFLSVAPCPNLISQSNLRCWIAGQSSTRAPLAPMTPAWQDRVAQVDIDEADHHQLLSLDLIQPRGRQDLGQGPHPDGVRYY